MVVDGRLFLPQGRSGRPELREHRTLRRRLPRGDGRRADFWQEPAYASLLLAMQERIHNYVVADQGTAQEALDGLIADWTEVIETKASSDARLKRCTPGFGPGFAPACRATPLVPDAGRGDRARALVPRPATRNPHMPNPSTSLPVPRPPPSPAVSGACRTGPSRALRGADHLPFAGDQHLPADLDGAALLHQLRGEQAECRVKWVGLRNYERILTDDGIWMNMQNTAHFLIWTIALQVLIASRSPAHQPQVQGQ